MKTKFHHNSLFVILIGFLFLFQNCQENEIIGTEQLDTNLIETSLKGTSKILICHFAESDNTWELINVSEKSLEKHLGHGDIRLDDQDGDGYVPNNSCGYGYMGDCNDSDETVNPVAEDICDDSVDNNCDGEIDEGCSFADYVLNTHTFTYESGFYNINLPFDCTLLEPGAQTLCDNGGFNNGDIIGMNLLNELGYIMTKSRDEISYLDGSSKKLIAIIHDDISNYGVNITRGYHFPPDSPYTLDEANNFLTSKLDDIQIAILNTDSAENINSYFLVIICDVHQYSELIEEAWNNTSNDLKANVFLYLVTSGGDDSFIF